jgi:hypothetical protein
MNSEDWRIVILAFIAVVPALMAAYWARGADIKSKRSEHKIDAVAITANNTQRMGEAVHTLVNSNMGAQLSISAAALRRIADLTKKKEDEVLATEAQRLLEDHKSRQAIVDSKPPPTATVSGQGTGSPADQALEEPHGNQ